MDNGADTDAPGEPDDAGDAEAGRIEDHRHLDAAIAMVAAGASRWVMVCGVRDANDLAERSMPPRNRVAVRAISPTSILVARADAVPEPLTAPAQGRPSGGRLAHVAHVVASLLR